MELLRYMIVFFMVGWGGGIIGSFIFLLTLPAVSFLRGTDAGRGFVAASKAGATLLAVYLAYHVAGWTGGEAKYLMFGVAFWAMVLNDLWRIRRARALGSMGGEPLDRTGMVRTEQWTLAADVVCFSIALAFLPRLALF